jgi:poly(3-hydroxybutyrate) depolymerase
VRSSTVIVTVSDFCRKGFVTRRRGVGTFRFSDCHDGVDVVEYFIDDTGHLWPGGINRLARI